MPREAFIEIEEVLIKHFGREFDTTKIRTPITGKEKPDLTFRAFEAIKILCTGMLDVIAIILGVEVMVFNSIRWEVHRIISLIA
jgi:hypothetical protein